MLKSCLCRAEHFRSPWYKEWFERLAIQLPPNIPAHRKHWEWAAISQALFERHCLKAGKIGLGFAVGTEPLPSLFAEMGATIEATDIDDADVAELWRTNNEYGGNLLSLLHPDVTSEDRFHKNVSFYHADMNDLSQFKKHHYDFLWSSCAIEHVGSLEKSISFVKRSMQLLKPGGIAVHTTEFNLDSTTNTVEMGGSILYRRSDLEQLDFELRKEYACIEPMDLNPGYERDDVLYDYQPYYENGRAHIKIILDGLLTTSLLLICRRY